MTRVLREVRQFRAALPGAGVVGVSGGADSVALLRALHACDPSLLVAHVNHRLRGAESDGDEAFVRELCAGLGVGCRVLGADVAALAAGGNLESTARRVRYEFFEAVARDAGAGWVATAHTADDQAETVLHRVIRGTGIQGLRGIAARKRPTPPAPPSLKGRGEEDNPPPSPLPAGRGSSEETPSEFGSRPVSSVLSLPLSAGRGLGGGSYLVRPLLAVTRADVLAYLNEIGQPFRTDSSNADTTFTRNRIRHELLPLLKSFNPDIVNALAHLAEHASEAHDIITASATELLMRAERPRAGSTLILDTAALQSAPRGLTRAAVRLVWEREGWPVSDMTFGAWERAVGVACGEVTACDFPGGVTLRAVGNVVQLTRRA